MNPFDIWIINELIKKKVLSSSEEVQTVIWFPSTPYEKYSCAIRLKNQPQTKNDINSGIFTKLDCVGNYINLIIEKQDLISQVFKILELYDNKTQLIITSDVVVEHTSLTPVYPINLATFRSSVIGNALVSIYREQGANVSTHYFVADTARNVDLVLKKYSIDNLLAFRGTGKNDHTCGVMFCESLKNIGKLSGNIDFKKMFPYSSNILTPSNIDREYGVNDARAYCDFCLQGHIETLEKANIIIDFFDYESDIVQAKNNNMLELNTISQENINNTYLFNNCLYYSTLSKNNCTVFSVISYRQNAIIKKAISFLKNKICVFPVFFNDVLIKKHNQIFTDVINEGIFHSVDKYIDDATHILNINSSEAIEALKLLFLSMKNGDIIQLNCESFSDLKKYSDILFFIKNTIDEIEQTKEISNQDIYLAKRLIIIFNECLFEGVIKNPQKPDLDIFTLVSHIKNIVQYINNNFYLQKFPINQKILMSTKKILFKVLHLLGIEI